MAHLVSARPSVREVPNLISGDDNTSLFQLLSYVCSSNGALMEGKISAQSTSCLSVELLSRVINVKYGCFSLPLTFLLVNANRSYSDTQPHPIIAYYFFI